MNRFAPLSVALFLLSAANANAQSVLVCHFSQNGGPQVAAVDFQTGALQTPGFIDLRADSAPANQPHQAVAVQGNWWVTDRVQEIVHVWSGFGAEYLGDQAGGFGDLYGGASAAGSTWFCQYTPGPSTGSLIEVSGGSTTVHPVSFNPQGIVAIGGILYITSPSTVQRFDPMTATELGAIYTTPSQGGHGQPTLRPSTGHLLIARAAGNSDVLEIDLAGNIVAEYETGADLGLTQPSAAIELADGSVLITTSTGIWTTDAAFTTATSLLDGVTARYVTLAQDVTIGTNYCGPAVPNSSGRSARVAATGAALASELQFRVAAHDLPNLQAGYFVASQTQGFTMNPGGSSGNLCLGGAIARLQSQVQNTSSVGYMDIEVDTTSIPLPTGPGMILAGETWNWQCWFRDVVGGSNTSNFSDAVSVTFN